MDSARYLALIDELCFRPFASEDGLSEHGPSEHGPSGADSGRSGHHLAELASSHGLRGGDPAERAAVVEQLEKERDALHELLASRWGETDPWNLQTVLLRTDREEIPEPWATLSARARTACLWAAEGTGRWVAVAVADRDEADEVQLLAVVTQTDPP